MPGRALISVSDKTGVADFARALAEMNYEIVSTGGTYKTLRQAGVKVTYVSEVTGFPEILDGRVKTLHPRIHGGILALRRPEHMEQLKQHDITPIDIVAVNLYPFRETVAKPGVSLEEAIENIDIGGPAMVRAAAKNHRHVLIVVNPERYDQVIEALKNQSADNDEFRLSLAREAFAHTAGYDTAIATYLQTVAGQGQGYPVNWHLTGELVQPLRYGENPHQRAAFYRDPSVQGPCVGNAEQLAGKELSYNNLLDLNSALELVKEFIDPTVVIIKHNNPCGAASDLELADAYRRAYERDPVSAFGGIVACNRIVDGPTAEEMAKIFLEAVIAPDFSPDALQILKQKTSLRLLKTGLLTETSTDGLDIRKINGGFLVQDADMVLMNPDDVKVVTEQQPDQGQMADLAFAMALVKHVKSNAIVVVKNSQLIGVGAGQMNRVGSARIALEQAGENARGAVLASDAFFPFRDTLDEAARWGISAIIQPGGSVRDEESVSAANQHGMAMIFTGMRHFKH